MQSQCFSVSSLQKNYQAAVVSALAAPSLATTLLTAKNIIPLTSFPKMLFSKTICKIINFENSKTYVRHILLLHNTLCASMCIIFSIYKRHALLRLLEIL